MVVERERARARFRSWIIACFYFFLFLLLKKKMKRKASNEFTWRHTNIECMGTLNTKEGKLWHNGFMAWNWLNVLRWIASHHKMWWVVKCVPVCARVCLLLLFVYMNRGVNRLFTAHLLSLLSSFWQFTLEFALFMCNIRKLLTVYSEKFQPFWSFHFAKFNRTLVHTRS